MIDNDGVYMRKMSAGKGAPWSLSAFGGNWRKAGIPGHAICHRSGVLTALRNLRCSGTHVADAFRPPPLAGVPLAMRKFRADQRRNGFRVSFSFFTMINGGRYA